MNTPVDRELTTHTLLPLRTAALNEIPPARNFHSLVLVLSHKRSHNALPGFPNPVTTFQSFAFFLISLNSCRSPGKDSYLFGTKPVRPHGGSYHLHSRAILPHCGLTVGLGVVQAAAGLGWGSCRGCAGCHRGGPCPCPEGAGRLQAPHTCPLQTARCPTLVGVCISLSSFRLSAGRRVPCHPPALVEGVISGYNATVFAHGPSGAAKGRCPPEGMRLVAAELFLTAQSTSYMLALHWSLCIRWFLWFFQQP